MTQPIDLTSKPDAAPEPTPPLRGVLAQVYRTKRYGTAGTLYPCDQVVLVGDGVPELDAATEGRPAVRLNISRSSSGAITGVGAVPYEPPPTGFYPRYFESGALLYSRSKHFQDLVGDRHIDLHDAVRTVEDVRLQD